MAIRSSVSGKTAVISRCHNNCIADRRGVNNGPMDCVGSGSGEVGGLGDGIIEAGMTWVEAWRGPQELSVFHPKRQCIFQPAVLRCD